ncbi:MerR family transcriptional regulator [Leifsonia sp. TF02-11]|uniref:MerR family transcriptional regulator n=1 Tax=Leifsonia sp. TF02-11 TaxID=2815212 RepID=UPI0027DE6D23|nr:MerR family transcriptional regulator [Leifsonia sp. TF02-11]
MATVMYTIGEFAAIGRISVRMLRHYDAIGLLPPARVDDYSGYRYYADAQLTHLLLIVELRQLGIGLDAIAAVLASADLRPALTAALRQRRVELEAGIADDRDRLDRLERRLRILEGTEIMSTPVEYRPLEALTVYAVSGTAPGMGNEFIGPMVGPLIGSLDQALATAGRPILEPSVFWYEARDDERLEVHISYPADSPAQPGDGYDIVELPEVPLAATLLHHGDMTGIGDSWMALTERLVADGYRIVGPTREVYVQATGHIPAPDWITELQAPVERVS